MPRQFQLRTLLIIVALCAFGTWWVIRPSQTAQWFVSEGYKSISLDDKGWRRFREMIDRAPNKIVITPYRRSWRDVLVGRQSFEVGGDRGSFSIDVTRGHVTDGPRLSRWGNWTIVF